MKLQTCTWRTVPRIFFVVVRMYYVGGQLVLEAREKLLNFGSEMFPGFSFNSFAMLELKMRHIIGPWCSEMWNTGHQVIR